VGGPDHGLPSRSESMDRLQSEEEMNSIPFEKCPVCGGDLIEKQVEKVLRGGVNTAVLKVCAEVCLRCGERLYSQETVRKFEQIRSKLERKETAEFQEIGVSYQVA
jgi:YgiT-type zinc finger domain-containing protein